MKAGVFYKSRDVRFEDVETPVLTGDEFDVLIEVKAAGICGSDMHYYRGEAPVQLPQGTILGHELSGKVLEVGEGVTNIKSGDRVGIEPLLGCGTCSYCQNGEYHLCKQLSHIGYAYKGGFAQYVKVPHNKVYKLTDEIGYEEATLLDGYAVGVHALHLVPIKLGDFIVVLGAGTIGICMAQIAQAAGASRVVLVGRSEAILDIAKEAGIKEVFNTSEDGDLNTWIQEQTNGLGADIVYETIGGNAPTLNQAVDIVRAGGSIGILGMHFNDKPINLLSAHMKEVKWFYCFSYARWEERTEFEIALNLLKEKKINARPLITHRYSLEQISEAFEMCMDKTKAKAIKAVVLPE